MYITLAVVLVALVYVVRKLPPMGYVPPPPRNLELERLLALEKQGQAQRDEATTAMILAISRGVDTLITQREPTLEEMQGYCNKRGLWVGRPGDMVQVLNQGGNVVLSAVAWKQVTDRLQPPDGGSGVQDWLNRKD